MGNDNTTPRPQPISQHEDIRRQLLLRLPVTHIKSYRSVYTKANNADEVPQPEACMTNDSSGEDAVLCFTKAKPTTNAAESPPYSYLDYGEPSTAHWQRPKPQPTPSSPPTVALSHRPQMSRTRGRVSPIRNTPGKENNCRISKTSESPNSTSKNEVMQKLSKGLSKFEEVSVPVFGATCNHRPFLEGPVLDILLPYLLGPLFSQV